MTTQKIKDRFYFAIVQNLEGKATATETETIVRHLYGCVQEVSDAIPSFEQCGEMEPKSDAHLDRFEMHQTLRQFGIEVEY